MLSLFESNLSVSVWMPNNFGYWQDRISLSDPTIPGTPEMGCLRPFVVTLEKSYCFVCSHCLQSTSKPHWIHMNYKQSLIQFRCQKVHMHVKKCQLTWEVWAWPECSLHMTKYCRKQSKAFTTGHAGVCMKKWFHNSLVFDIQQINTNRSAMASNTPAFKAALTRIQFAQACNPLTYECLCSLVGE